MTEKQNKVRQYELTVEIDRVRWMETKAKRAAGLRRLDEERREKIVTWDADILRAELDMKKSVGYLDHARAELERGFDT